MATAKKDARAGRNVERKRKRETDAELKRTFMTQLRRHRLAAGLDQGDVASRVGVSVSAVSRWESGMDIPRGKRFQKLARVLGIDALALTHVMDPEPVAVGAK
jgi:ribosome-binding protein aMBF1 (putative translation factor)